MRQLAPQKIFNGDVNAVTKPATIPAPVGGLNARDAVSLIPPTDAVRMVNLFPTTSDVELRNGNESHVTGFGVPIGSLMTWRGPTSQKLKAVAGTAIYDATSAGAVGAAEVSGLTNDDWEYINKTTSGGSFLCCVNGADSYRTYDGSSWATPSITGVTSSDLNNIWSHAKRVWFVEKDTMSGWYLGTNNISGAATEFNFGTLFNKGGYLVAGGSWSRDSGAGADDVMVVITSEGEVAVYSGTDPSSSSTWGLLGVFETGRPVGRRCMQKLGGELLILTEIGVVPVSELMRTAFGEQRGITDKIRGKVEQEVKDHRTREGWQIMLHPGGNKLIVNVPQYNSTFIQWVMNIQTGAWTIFDGWDGFAWTTMSGELYYGASGTVYKADTGNSDDGTAIQFKAQTAWLDFQAPGYLKDVTMVRPLVLMDSPPELSLSLFTDYQDGTINDATALVSPTLATWDDCDWDECFWADALRLYNVWAGVAGLGHVVSLYMAGGAESLQMQWKSTDFLFQYGNLV